MIRHTAFPLMIWAALWACCTPAAGADAPADVARLLAKLPADDIATGQRICADIVQLGPQAVRQITAMLTPEGSADARARYALNGLAYHVTRPGAEAERAMYSGVLIDAIAADPPPLVKTFLVGMLQLVGKEEAVAPLSKLLHDPDLCQPAAQALVRINTPGVIPALANALPTAKDAGRLTIICALGDLRAKSAAEAILPYAAAPDPNVRRLALYALANSGAPAASDVLAKAADVQPPYERAHATALYLTFAARLAEAGDKQRCAAICRQIIKTRTAPQENHFVADALSTLVAALGAEALDEILAAADSPNLQLRHAALKLTHNLPGDAVTARLIAQMARASPEIRADIVITLADRGDPKALLPILDALKDKDKAVRLSAATAASRFPGADVVAALLTAINSAQPDEINPIQDALARIPGPQVLASVAAEVPKAPVPARIALIQVLSARRARAHIEVVFGSAAAADPSVRLAAIKALGDLADANSLPRLIDLLLSLQDAAQQAEASRALVLACQRDPDTQQRAQPILAALPRTSGNTRSLLLKSLAQLGGRTALAAVVAETRSNDSAVADAAVRALADWPDASAAGDLLTLARTAEKDGHRILALRGYVRLVGLPSNRPVAQTVRMYKDALDAAKRAEEKKLILAGLSNLRAIEALKAVALYLDDQALGAEAAVAALKIVLPADKKDAPLKGPDVLEIMKKLADVAKDATLKDKANAYINAAGQGPR